MGQPVKGQPVVEQSVIIITRGTPGHRFQGSRASAQQQSHRRGQAGRSSGRCPWAGSTLPVSGKRHGEATLQTLNPNSKPWPGKSHNHDSKCGLQDNLERQVIVPHKMQLLMWPTMQSKGLQCDSKSDLDVVSSIVWRAGSNSVLGAAILPASPLIQVHMATQCQVHLQATAFRISLAAPFTLCISKSRLGKMVHVWDSWHCKQL